MNNYHNLDVYFIHIYSYSEAQIRIRNQKLYKTAVLFLLNCFRRDHKFKMFHQVITSKESQQRFRLKIYKIYLFSYSLNIYSIGPEPTLQLSYPEFGFQQPFAFLKPPHIHLQLDHHEIFRIS